MGVVIKQSAYASLINYVGVAVGAINTLFLFTAIFTTEELGLFKTIFSMGIMFAPVAQAGIGRSTIRFFPRFKNSPLAAGRFLMLVLLLAMSTFLLFSCIYYLADDLIFSFFQEKAAAIIDYQNLILGLILIMAFITILDAYFKTHLNVTVSTFMREVFLRVASAILGICYFLNVLSFDGFLYLSVFNYCLSAIFLIIILVIQKKLFFNYSIFQIEAGFAKNMLKYMFFIMAGAIGSVIVLQIDQIMVSGYEGFSAGGIYVVAFFMATVIEIPRRSITQMSDAIIAAAFENERLDQVKKIYKQSSINQFLLGAFAFGLIVSNLENIYAVIPNGDQYQAGIWVVIIIGAGKLIDMLYGVNSEIIISSNFYKYNILFVVILAVLTVSLNAIFIPMYGINGAAFASLISIFAFNTMKLFFIYSRFRFIPFSKQTLVVFLIGIVSIGSVVFLPNFMEAGLLKGLIIGSIFTIIFSILTLVLKPSTEVHHTLITLWNKFIIKK